MLSNFSGRRWKFSDMDFVSNILKMCDKVIQYQSRLISFEMITFPLCRNLLQESSACYLVTCVFYTLANFHPLQGPNPSVSNITRIWELGFQAFSCHQGCNSETSFHISKGLTDSFDSLADRKIYFKDKYDGKLGSDAGDSHSQSITIIKIVIFLFFIFDK